MYSRNDRLKELYKEHITQLLREVKEPGLTGFLNVTDLSLSVDRKIDTVYYSILGSEAEREAAGKASCEPPYLRVLLKKK